MRLEPIVGLRPGGAAMLAAFAVLAAWQPVIAQNSRRLQLFTREGSLAGGYKVWRITIREMDLLARGRAASVGFGLLILGLILHPRIGG